ncbi:MAG: Inositol 2-dehydrogenase/D-chiro-inositol 3-dehydrogenase [Fimbriimonadaceae bacterium]|nr:Inositol 2-dehydrogenase/D-chiro-inositol 3-dehydrogenase [Fimbriimonadaceae bacterium]
MDRRTFLKGIVAAGAYAALPPGVFGAAETLRRMSANAKVNVAFVGIGNRGADLVRALSGTGLVNVVALCDTELGAKHTVGSLSAFPSAAQFRDFRTMFDKMHREIDAVCVGTPDHSHFPVTMQAMSLGKHVYVEKPLAHSFRQIELLMAAEKKYKVACQMGNQGHSEANYFQFKAWTEVGIIKNVTRITTFMNNPRRWHGKSFSDYLPKESTPEQLDWECWIATATEHPFNPAYLNGEWRSWYDFGNGALGDWGAHIFDTAHEFLELGLPVEVDPILLDGHSRFIFPQASTIAFRFPARGSMPPVELTWYDGVKNLPPLPKGFAGGVVDPNIPPPSSGTIDPKGLPPGKVIYGEGMTFKGGSHASTLEIIPGERARDLKLPDVPKTPSDHFLNFVRACQGEERTRSHFGVAGPLCQAMAIGIIAQRVNARLAFDRGTKQITNHEPANELLKGPPPRKGWEQYYKV